MSSHLWQGQRVDDAGLASRLETLDRTVDATLLHRPETPILLEACERLAQELLAVGSVHEALVNYGLTQELASRAELVATLQELGVFLQKTSLETKLRRELGSLTPFDPERVDFKTPRFEAWAPLGCLVHIAPGNALATAFLSGLEGLLAGNLNLIKTSSGDRGWTAQLFQALGACDASHTLAKFVCVLEVSSSREDILTRLFEVADGVVAWGGEEAVDRIRAQTPPGARLIEWGHRISFAFVSTRALEANQVDWQKIAEDICLGDQQACSSPQDLLLESRDPHVLWTAARELAAALDVVSKRIAPSVQPGFHETAELRRVTRLQELESALNEHAGVIEAPDRSWRLLVDPRPGLRASPLFRTLWISPLPREDVLPSLRPLSRYLQTVGLTCLPEENFGWSRLFAAAGVTRTTPAGRMQQADAAEPHDGVYALPRYARRVSFLREVADVQGVTRGSDFEPRTLVPTPPGPIQTKEDFGRLTPEPGSAEMYFRSGGTSGAPKLSTFRYDDYATQMKAAAEGLFAAGLDPTRDRCMNLFYGGNLYGGFLSFFSILEHLKAIQFPMAAQDDLSIVADAIERFEVDTLFAMPSYLLRFFREQGAKLTPGRVKKIFYGGEHFTGAQRAYLQKEFGVALIRSAAYGANDAGPLGYQCRRCEGSLHHVHANLHDLEIVALDRDEPVAPGQAGRILVTPRYRRGLAIRRYDTGDLGRWVDPCACGRTAPLLELMGRQGDVARVGATFINVAQLRKVLAEDGGFTGEAQLRISTRDLRDAMELRLTGVSPAEASRLDQLVRAGVTLLGEIVDEGLTSFVCVPAEPTQLARAAGTGKLLPFVDERKS